MVTLAEKHLRQAVEEANQNVPRDLGAWSNLATKLKVRAERVLGVLEDQRKETQ